MSSEHDPNQNHLLAAVLDAEYARLAPHLESIPMLLGDVLYESGDKLPHVYFPTTSIVSLQYVLEDGASPVSAMKAWSAFRYSWAVTRLPAVP